ncbi:MAG: class I SAM-dependent methyltransferase [Jatrophihabitantaceae bacterium]
MTPERGQAGPRADWNAWHEDYADPDSALSARLAVVGAQIRGALADHAARQAEQVTQGARAGPLTVLSACAGDGRDVLGVLAEQDERLCGQGHRVEVALLETDRRNLDRAERFCRDAGLAGVRFLDRDAGLSSSYLDAAPADLVLMCGVFGNLTDADVRRLIRFLPALCRPGATLIWTRSRRAPDLTPSIRDWLAATGFTELSFVAPPDVQSSVGTHRFDGEPAPVQPDQRLFSFIR